MAKSLKGDVVVPFPFSDLKQSKRRPALVLASLDGDDLILCQITSQQSRDRHAIPLQDADFASGNLRQSSYIRPNRLFTADQALILYRIGTVQTSKLEEAVDHLIDLLRH
ncbi:MAG TPA: type II toxin-antitoxin system PemK/MazF family toxin [Thermoanaerobaculia bacterium]|nr:type II toxin-antitoxin system PemK/MazF family toxin [Thermoanaerobaculia bacterium]